MSCSAGALPASTPEKGESLCRLACHLYTLRERTDRAEDDRAYDEIIGAWHTSVTASHGVEHKGESLEL